MKNVNSLGRFSGLFLASNVLVSGVLMANNAFAHDGIASASSNSFVSLLQGFAHPFSGLDHLVGLFLVGVLIAMQAKKQAFFTGLNTLALFALALVVGGFMSVSQIAVAEFAVLASIVVTVVLLAAFGMSAKSVSKVDAHVQAGSTSKRQVLLKLAALAAPAVIFAHGLAHGAEAVSIAYGVGSVVGATVLTVLSFVAAKVWASKFTPAKVQG